MVKQSKFLVIIIFSFLFFAKVIGQNEQKPKLIIGIVVDQMRSEYIYRFQENFSENGFKRILKGGFNNKNTHYNYLPTATAPGHASIYTGTTPSNHGIVGNEWYSQALKKKMYCAEDPESYLIGIKETTGVKVTKYSRSPKNLLASTITDELKLFSNGKSKVIGVSLKDRGAIFPAGHLADYAFWYHSESGKFITSSYYSKKLPSWLIAFNDKNLSDSLLNLTWELTLPEHKSKSGPDNNHFEKHFVGKPNSNFPYDIKKLRVNNGDFSLLTELPFGNTLLTKMAKATILGEKLGQSNQTDMITISFSSTDYIGHYYGIRSKELEDTYIRLDQNLSELFQFLDGNIGQDNYLLFLTADHAAADNPEFLKENRLPGGFYSIPDIKKRLNSNLSTKFGEQNYVSFIDKTQIYLEASNKPYDSILEYSKELLKNIEGVRGLFVPNNRSLNINSNVMQFMENSYHPINSGDILINFYPGWMDNIPFGTTHYSNYNYDTHVPLLWFGKGVKHGETVSYNSITQIAPTLSFLMDIPLPNMSNKNPIVEIFE